MKALIIAFFLTCGVSICAQLTPTLNDIWIPTRDGDSLQADVYIPTGVTQAEVILIQTPYNKNNFANGLPLGILQNLDGQPYIWVIVDWRGFYGSSNADVSDFERGEDGYDICEWISQQPWHGDRIGTWGPSALGGVQVNTMVYAHPNHTCAVPQVFNPQQSYDAYFYGGVLEEGRLNQLDVLGYGLSPVILSNPYYSNVWQFSANNTHYPDDISIPTLQIGGWYDHTLDKMLAFYAASRTEAGVDVQDEQWLLIGPWVHGGTGAAYVGSVNQGELSYPNAGFRSDVMARQFFDYYLLDSLNSWDTTSMITYYKLGENNWAVSNATALGTSSESTLYLNNQGGLGGATSSGHHQFVCDPSNPAPTIGGATLSTFLDQGPYDQSELDSRTDVVQFTSQTFEESIYIEGQVSAALYVSSDQPDGDLVVKLVDQYPDGRKMLITDGIKRMRFRNGSYTENDESFLTPGEIVSVDVDLPFTSYTFLPGHQLKIYIAGNSDIRWNVNRQDGGEMYVAGDTNVAVIKIHHDEAHPSRIILPGNNPTLSVPKLQTSSVFIYPNPAMETIQIHSEISVNQVTVFNTVGQKIKLQHPLGNQLSIKTLPTGFYFCKIEFEDGSVEVIPFEKK